MSAKTIPGREAAQLQEHIASSITTFAQECIDRGYDRDFIVAGIAACGLSLVHATGGDIHEICDSVVDAIDRENV
jgi:hypothetical protein